MKIHRKYQKLKNKAVKLMKQGNIAEYLNVLNEMASIKPALA